MSKNQKSKNYAVTKLHKILDYNSKKDIRPENEKYLGSLSQRLKEISGEEIILKRKINKEILEDGADTLKPKVIVHAREVKKESELPEIKIEEKKKREFRGEDIFEIKKIKIKEPKFIEVKPKASSKEEIIEIGDLKAEEEKLLEWDSIEVHKKEEKLEELPELESISQIEIKKTEPEPFEKIKEKKEEKKEIDDSTNFCPECGTKLDNLVEVCSNCGKKIRDEEIPSFIPVKKVEKEHIPSEWEPIEIEKPKDEKISFIEKEVKITVFKDFKSIDDEIAALLYNNGITTIDLLNKATLKELTKIKGIKKKAAKRIKKELKKMSKKPEKEKPIEIEVFEKEDFIEEEFPVDKEIEEESEEWSSNAELTSKPSVWEPIEDEFKETEEKETVIFEEFTADKEIEKSLIDEEIKVEVFRNIKSIDSKTAVLLFDNGYSTVDALIEAPIKDLIKIEGIKRKTVKKIKKELDKTESTPSIIPSEEKQEKTKTDNFQKIREELDTTKQEFKTITKELNKKEKNTQKLQEELDDKIKDLESKKTELYNRDEEIKQLQNQSEQSKQELEIGSQELNKKQEEIDQLQKGLEDKTLDLESKTNEIDDRDKEIKQLQNQLEKRLQELETGNSELNKKEEEIEKIKQDLLIKTEELDEKYKTITELQSELTDKQKELERKDKEIKIKAFKDMISIDDETAILLFDNGITTIDALKTTPQKSLIKIKGIKRKKANHIKKELDEKSNKESFQELEPEIEKRPTEYIPDKKETTKKLKAEEERSAEYSADENEITKYEAREIDKKIADEFSLVVIDDDIFEDIKSIDEKTSKLLKENGITTIDALKVATVKDLTKIKGIKRKIAKQIKKEIINSPETDIDKKVEASSEGEEEISGDEEETEWEYYDEHLISHSTLKEYKGFRQGDYSLYKKEIETKSGKKRAVRFFSKAEPDDAEPIDLPNGYEVKKNKKTGLPYLRKKK